MMIPESFQVSLRAKALSLPGPGFVRQADGAPTLALLPPSSISASLTSPLHKGGWAPAQQPRWPLGTLLTLLDELLRLLPDAGVSQKPPLPLLADLTLQVMLFWDLQQ